MAQDLDTEEPSKLPVLHAQSMEIENELDSSSSLGMSESDIHPSELKDRKLIQAFCLGVLKEREQGFYPSETAKPLTSARLQKKSFVTDYLDDPDGLGATFWIAVVQDALSKEQENNNEEDENNLNVLNYALVQVDEVTGFKPSSEVIDSLLDLSFEKLETQDYTFLLECALLNLEEQLTPLQAQENFDRLVGYIQTNGKELVDAILDTMLEKDYSLREKIGEAKIEAALLN
jgi:hypothetical protein